VMNAGTSAVRYLPRRLRGISGRFVYLVYAAALGGLQARTAIPTSTVVFDCATYPERWLLRSAATSATPSPAESLDKRPAMHPALIQRSGAKIQRKMFRKFGTSERGITVHSARARKITGNDTHEAMSDGGDSKGESATGAK